MFPLLVKSVKFLNPQKIIDQLELKKGIQVADFGCGAGDFVIAAAKVVGAEGKVYAIDIRDSALSSARSKARIENLFNIDFLKADLENYGSSGLPDGTQDAVLLTNILHQVEKKDDVMKECQRVLKYDGAAVIVDWKKEAAFGPEKETRMDVSKIKSLAQRHDFAFQREINAGACHYGIIFIRK